MYSVTDVFQDAEDTGTKVILTLKERLKCNYNSIIVEDEEISRANSKKIRRKNIVLNVTMLSEKLLILKMRWF